MKLDRVLIGVVIGLLIIWIIVPFTGLLGWFSQKDKAGVVNASDAGQEQWVEIVVDRVGQFTYGGTGFTKTDFVIRSTNGDYYHFDAFVMDNSKEQAVARKIALVIQGDKISIRADERGEIKDLRFLNPNP